MFRCYERRHFTKGNSSFSWNLLRIFKETKAFRTAFHRNDRSRILLTSVGGGGGGLLLGICRRGVPPGSPNPDPISDQNMPFSIPVFRPDIYVYKGLNYVTIALVRTLTTDLLKFSSNNLFWLFLFLSFSFGVEKTKTFIRSRGSLRNHTRFQTIMVKI